MSLSVPATDERKREEAADLFSSLPPLSSLCLGFIWPTGGCMQTGTGLLWSPSSNVQLWVLVCLRVCVSVQACLNSAEFSYHSSAGPADALGPCLFFHLLRFLSIFSFSMTHTHKQESRSDLEKEKEAWLLGSCVAERYLRSDWTNSSSSPWASVSLRFAE